MAAFNGQKVFGAGQFWGIPTSSGPTPSQFYVPQNISLDFKRDIKRLFGQNQLPVDIASGTLSVVGKVTMGTLNARLLNDLMLGASLSTGQVPYIARETVVASSTSGAFNVANAIWSLDLGLLNSANGIPLVRTLSTAPASTGQYYVTSSGGYIINATDAAALLSLRVSYLYSDAANGGQKVSMTNQAMGKIGAFQAVIGYLWGTEKASIQLNSCMASDYGLNTVLDDYTKPAFGFEAACDTSDVLGTMSFAEVN